MHEMTIEEGIGSGRAERASSRRGENTVLDGPDRRQTAEDGMCGQPDGDPVASARRLAERAHTSVLEPNGRPIIEHVRRVAEAVPAFARRVAWLHDALEWTQLDDLDLRSAGLDAEEITAVRLLTREEGGSDDRAFLAHVRAIAEARGRAGRIARAVKRADMTDRSRHPRDPGARWIPPYERALAVIAADEPRSGGTGSDAQDA